MSFTREEWFGMWKSIKWLETHEVLSNRSRKELQKIKDLIQQVVGQLEL